MRLTELAHQKLADHLRPGDSAIDATVGNGYDTLALASLVGPEGRVYGYDAQALAIETTRERLISAEQFLHCQLLQADHAEALASLLPSLRDRAAAAVFNLGYLPGSDHDIQTSAASTLPALDAAAMLLRAGGLLLVTAYRGHPGGSEEAEAVAGWMQNQASAGWSVDSHEPAVPSHSRLPPILWEARRPDR